MYRFLILLVILLRVSPELWAQVHVKGYYKSNGTYVQPHERTRPNSTITDNYSYPGNYNPNTGKITGGNVGTYQNNSGANYLNTNATNSPSINTTSNNAHSTSSGSSDYSSPLVISPVSESYNFSRLIKKSLTSEAVQRRRPYSQSAEMGRIPKGTTITLDGRDSDFYKVTYNGGVGYIHFVYIDDNYATFLSNNYPRAEQQGKTDTQALLRERPDSNSPILYRVPAGTRFKLYNKIGDYWTVEVNGYKGFLNDVYVYILNTN